MFYSLLDLFSIEWPFNDNIYGAIYSICDIELQYRKILKISPSMYKPLQIQAPQTRNAKNPPLNRPSKYKPPGGLYLENCPQIQSKTKQKW